MLRAALLTCLILIALPLRAAPLAYEFPNIDGGVLEFAEWQGQPILVVNTASECGFTGQYEGLQALYDRYKDQGLIVLAVPSDDFQQELASGEEVKQFCEMAFGLDMPMADISRVIGSEAHPFYKHVRDESGFEPRWNFNKVLIGRDGSVVGTWGSAAKPLSGTIVRAVEKELRG